MTVITDRFETDVILNESDDFIEVWSDRRKCFFRIDREEFLTVWRDIHKVWMHDVGRSSLTFGCGRETFTYMLYTVTKNWYPANYLRTILEIGVGLEWVIPSRSKTSHSIFNLRPIRYEHLL